jgi:hypothetical protein
MEDEMGRTCSALAGEQECADVSLGKSVGKRPVGRPRRKWEDNIKLDLRDRTGWYGLD